MIIYIIALGEQLRTVTRDFLLHQNLAKSHNLSSGAKDSKLHLIHKYRPKLVKHMHLNQKMKILS